MPVRLERGSKPRVLTVDDDPVARTMVRLALMTADLEVVEAASGSEALAAFTAERPDAVLLDVHMEDMDGFAVCSAIRSLPEGTSVPIVVMTGDDRPETINQAYQAGATDFEDKQVAPAVLCQRILFLLRAKHTVDELQESERRLGAAQRLARLGNWEWDVKTGRHLWSSVMRELLGATDDGAQESQETFLDRVHTQDRARVTQEMADALTTGRGCLIEHRIVRPDGAQFIVQQRAETVTAASGESLGLVGTLQDITDLRRAEERVRQLAYFDALTGLPNRALFTERLQDALTDAERRKCHMALVFLDLDNFKDINDTFGHLAGDHMLKEVGDRLRSAVRAADTIGRIDHVESDDHTVCRLGGDEFVVLLSGLQQPDHAGTIASRVIYAIRQPFLIEGNEVFVTGSAGVGVFPDDGRDAVTLIKNADSAMYAAKEEGRNAVRFFDPALNERTTRRLSVESGIRRALERDEFRMFYQAIVSEESGEVLGAECLIRWQHPDEGLVFPDQFIPMAEESGLIVSIGDWVMWTVCRQQQEWAGQGLAVPLSFNVSTRQLQNEGFGDRLATVLRDTGASPERLTIELTEGALLTESEVTRHNLSRIKELGLSIALDDFGKGYSSLSYLRQLAVSSIKVDRSFVQDLADDCGADALVEIISMLARRLGIELVAEGVETEGQRAILKRLGYRQMQGFLFTRAVPASEFVDFLARARVLIKGAQRDHIAATG